MLPRGDIDRGTFQEQEDRKGHSPGMALQDPCAGRLFYGIAVQLRLLFEPRQENADQISLHI